MSHRWIEPARWLSASVIALVVLVRLMSVHPRTPWWDLDPARQVMPETALLPSTGLMLDALVWLCAAVTIAAAAMAGERVRWKTGLLALLGASGVVYWVRQGAIRSGAGPDDLFAGSAWASAVIGGWALSHLGANPVRRRVIALTLAGSAWALTARGGHQVFVEHARTVADFQAHKESVLISSGIEPGSGGAREFERRLMQPEATAWVGLSNANASVLAGCFGVLLGAAFGTVRAVRRDGLASGNAGVMVIGAAVAGAGLVLTFSKGGLVAGAIAVGVASASVFGLSFRGSLGRKFRWGLAALPVLALVGVGVRGLVGERIGELSLLFRSQYLVGAMRVIGTTFPWGCGPGGFKAAYAMIKLPEAPELVESPHSVLLDWAATLGVFGVAWGVLLGVWLWRAVQGGTRGEQHDDEPGAARAWLWGAAPVLMACALAWWREAPVVAADEWPLRIVAVLGWISVIALGVRSGFTDAGLIAAAVALVTHAQIEVTPVLPATGAIMLGLVGLAAGAGTEVPPRYSPARRLGVLAVATLMVCGAVLSLARVPRILRWEENLRVAVEYLAPLARARTELAKIEPGESATSRAAEIVQRELNARVSGSVGRALLDFQKFQGEYAIARLSHAWDEHPGNLKPIEHMLRLRIDRVREERVIWGNRSLEPERLALHVRALADAVERQDGALAVPCAAVFAGAFEAAAAIDQDRALLQEAAKRWQIVAEGEPGSLLPWRKLALLRDKLEDHAGAAEAARRALANDALLRLDPVKQLRPAERAELERIAGSAG